jgi:hypothetical protein
MWRVYLFEFIFTVIISWVWVSLIDKQIKEDNKDNRKIKT